MNSEIKKKVKKPRKPRTTKPIKKGRTKDKSVKQNVNVNVTSSGGGGSGGASIPSAQPSYNPFLNQASQAEREANRGLLNRLDQLLKKQDDINPLVKSLEKKPDSIEIKEEIRQELKKEDVIQDELEDELFDNINNELEAERVAYESRGGLTSEGEKEQKRRLRDQIRELGGTTSNAENLQSLKNKLSSLQSIEA